MKCLDLFSGIGGFALACEWAGIETVAFCEIEPYCQAVLKKHWPSVLCHDDIRTLKGKDYEGIDLICGGFPCQPYSVAGKRRGTADDRDLWPEMLRVIIESHPNWVCAENTPGFLTVGLDKALADLEGGNYEGRAVVLPAISTGAPHIRQRLFIIAHRNESNYNKGKMQTGRPHIRSNPTSMEHTPSNRRFEREAESSEWSIDSGRWWNSEPDVGRVAHGIPNRVDRLKALGNAVVPQQVYPILKAIIDCERAFSPNPCR